MTLSVLACAGCMLRGELPKSHLSWPGFSRRHRTVGGGKTGARSTDCGRGSGGVGRGGGGWLRGLAGRGNSVAGVVNRMLHGLKIDAFAGEVGV